MRLGSLALAGLALVSWSCSSGGGGPDLPAQDYSASFTGWWIGTQTGTINGDPVVPRTGSLEITREEVNRLRLGASCPDGTSVPAQITGATSFTVPQFTCAVAADGSCPSVTMTWNGGSGTLDRGVLSLELRGTWRGCGQSYALVFVLDALRDAPPPEIAALSPAWATVRDPGLTLTVTGAGFAPKAIVRFGNTLVPTEFVSGGELRATLAPNALAFAGEVPVTVVNVDVQSSLPATFQVRNPVPALAAIAPTAILAGTAGATVTLNGSGFVQASSVSFGGVARSTTYVAPTRVQVWLPPEDLVLAGERALTVTNPPPGGGTSGPVLLQVRNPAPVATGVFPEVVAAGGPRSYVTVTGSSFVPGTTVRWNGAPRRTHVASSTTLSVEILVSDVAEVGSAALSVENPPPGGGSAAAGTVRIETPPAVPAQSVAYQIDPGHGGRARSGGTLAFPGSSAWSVTLPDTVSYPLVADGKVFVVVRASGTGGYGSRLFALDLATGATAWGPREIGGTYFRAGHAYEAGKIFVVNGDGLLRAFDAATGATGWTVDLPGQYAFSAPPTASGGVVYVGGAGVGGTVYAVDASSGAVLWTHPVANGDQSAPAVAPDAVYVSYPCQVYKLDRRTGAALWVHSTGCSGGGGKTAAYAGGELYVRDFRSYDEPAGVIHDALDGSVTGTFGAPQLLPIPALDGGARYVLAGTSLERWERDGTVPTWSFAGDGQLASAPIVVDDAVVIGSGSGKVFAVDAVTGLERWNGSAGAAVVGPDEHNVSGPLTGLGAGEGYLVVPAGRQLTAWRIVAP